MKKSVRLSLSLVLCLMLSLSFAYAGWFSNLFNGEVTGNVILSPSLENGIVSYWNLDGDLEDLVGNNDGVESGSGLDCNQEGVNGDGKSCYFSKSSLIFIPNSPSLSYSDNLTVSLWFKPYLIQDNAPYARGLIGKFSSTSDANFVVYYDGRWGPGSVQMYANRGGVWGPVSGRYTSLKANNWYHLVWAYENGGTLYINGEKVGDKTGSGLLKTNSQGLLIGKGYTNDHYGLIDNVGIWNRALSDAEVADLYESYSVNNSNPEPSCVDSDANAGHPDGLNYYEKGTLTYTNEDGVSFASDDKCITNTSSVSEGYCGPNSVVYDCSLEDMVCQDGRCVLNYLINQDFGIFEFNGSSVVVGLNEPVDDAVVDINAFEGGEFAMYDSRNTSFKPLGVWVIDLNRNFSSDDMNILKKKIGIDDSYVIDYEPTDKEDYQIMLFRSTGDDNGIVWTSGDKYIVIYFEHYGNDDYWELKDLERVVEAYLVKYPSDLKLPSAQVCQPFIDSIKNPKEFYDNSAGINWVPSWNVSYSDQYVYIEGNKETFTDYYTYYSSWANGASSSLDYRVQVFDNLNIELGDYLKETVLTNTYCSGEDFYIGGDHNVRQGFYYCIYPNDYTLTGNYNFGQESASVFWYKDNVLIMIQVSQHGSLSDAEVGKEATMSIVDFLESLKNNQYQRSSFIDWNSLDFGEIIDGPMNNAFSMCGSEIDGEQRFPAWQCKTEPVICPEYGEQKIICVDDKDVMPSQSWIQQCSPGICSGCYVPRWFEGSEGNNKCIPYGFRFEQQQGWTVEQKIIGGEINLSAREGDYSDEVEIIILSDDEVIWTFLWDNSTYRFNQGSSVKISLPYDSYNGGYAIVTMKEIHYSSYVGAENYIVYDVFIYQDNVISDFLNMYCDIDGQVKVQKTQAWGSCQNNYECESNICSYGECVDLKGLADQANVIKSFFIKLLCRLSNPLSDDGYNQCLYDYLGEVIEETPSSGGSGGSSSSSA